MNTNCGIYAIRAKNGKQYIGSSCDIKRRWRDHRRSLELGTHHSPRLQAAWNKHGCDAFEFIVVKACAVDELMRTEQNYLDELQPALNMAKYVDAPCRGRVMPDHERARVSEHFKNLPKTDLHRARISAALKGKTFSETTREKMRESGKRKIFTEAHKAALSVGHIGREGQPRSAETRALISAAKKGHKRGPFTDEHKQRISKGKLQWRYYCVELDRWFESSRDVHTFLVDECDRSVSYLTACSALNTIFSVNPRQKTAYGFHWQRDTMEAAIDGR